MKTESFRWNALLLVIGVLVSGCADLILRDTDSTAETTGKVAARVLLCPLTICMSEIGLAEAKGKEEREAQRYEEQVRYRQWFKTLTPEQQERERDRQAQLEAARIQALGMLLGRGGFQLVQPAPYQAPVYQPAPAITTPRQPLNCTSNRVGNQVYTNCN